MKSSGARPKFKPKMPKKKASSSATANDPAPTASSSQEIGDSSKPNKSKKIKPRIPRKPKKALPERLANMVPGGVQTAQVKAEPGVAVASTASTLFEEREIAAEQARQDAAVLSNTTSDRSSGGKTLKQRTSESQASSESNKDEDDVSMDGEVEFDDDTLGMRASRVRGLKMESNWETSPALWAFDDDPVGPVQLPFVPESVPRSSDSAAKLFHRNDKIEMEIVESQDSKLFFMQFPKELPLVKDPLRMDLDETEGVKSEPQDPSMMSAQARATAAAQGASAMNKMEFGEAPSLKDVKPGKVGKLKVYRSGKVKLHFDNVVFDVSPGVKCGFAQQVTAINTSGDGNGSYMPLATVSDKLVCTPDVTKLPL